MSDRPEAGAQQIEITTRKGNSLCVSWTGRPPSFPYEFIVLRDGHEFMKENISFDDMHALVEFIGYPKETSERADRLKAELEMARAHLDDASHLIDRLRAEKGRMRSYASILVNELQDAWWLKAAHAYEELRALLLGEQ